MREVSPNYAALEFCPQYDGLNEQFLVRHFEILTRGNTTGVLIGLCGAEDALNGGGSCPIREISIKAHQLGYIEQHGEEDFEVFWRIVKEKFQ